MAAEKNGCDITKLNIKLLEVVKTRAAAAVVATDAKPWFKIYFAIQILNVYPLSYLSYKQAIHLIKEQIIN